MQDMGRNEKFTGLVGCIRERIHDWGFRHPWIARPFWYFALLMVVLGVCHGVFNYFDLYHTDADSARYLLSAMVQAQAAIVAIVITLTLIAVQLTASAYSPRVTDIFKKNPDMWLLLGFYGLSMLYGFVVLKMVEGAEGEVVSQEVVQFLGFVPISFECCVSFACWIGAFTLVALFPYMLNIIDLLKPENIINRLAVKITKDGVLNSKEDSIQPIVDIIHGSVMKYDLETVRVGLNAITDRVIKIIDSDGQKNISTRFCYHFERIGRLTVGNMDEESTIEVIKNLYNFWELTAEKRIEDARLEAAKSIGEIGTTAAEKRLELVAVQAARFLKNIGTTTAEKGLNDTTMQAARSLRYVGKAAAENGLEDTTWRVAQYLGEIGTTAIKERLELATSRVARSLRDVGKAAAENRLVRATSDAAWYLGEVGKIAAEKGLEDTALQAARFTGDIGKAAIKNGLDEVAEQTAKHLAELTISDEEIGTDAIRELWRNDRDRVWLYSFTNLYDRKLKELRTQKPD